MLSTADDLSASSSSSAASLESKDYWVKKCLDLAAAKNAAEVWSFFSKIFCANGW